MPVGVVTVTSTTPVAWAGEVAVIEVALTTVTPVAATPPKLTAVAPVKLVPVMVTEVPPNAEPLLGATDVTAGPLKVNWSDAPVALMPPPVVTVTSTTPVECTGEVAVIEVALTTVKPAAAVPPNITAVAPVKLVPAMVTAVPPAPGPEFGLTEVTVGATT